MDLYNKAYKLLEGSGIGNNSLVIWLKDALDKPRLKKPIMVNGYLLWEGDRDVLGLLHHDGYESKNTELVKEHSKGVGLDLGANIGYFSLLMAQKCDTVYSFEPASYTFGLLKHNIELNKSRNIIAEQAAVGKESGTASLSINKTDIGSNSFISQGPTEHGTENVKVVKLDEYFKGKTKPNIIKMDVEGWEEEAILGGREVFSGANFIIFENNLRILKRRGKQGDEVPKLIESFGFRVKRINETETSYDCIAMKD